MNPELKRSIILDHYQNPRNKELVDDDSYYFQNMNNINQYMLYHLYKLL